MFGMGAGTNVSQALGARDEERAQRFAATSFFTAFATGILIAVVCNLSIDPPGALPGRHGDHRPLCQGLRVYIFYAAPFMMCSFVMNNLLRFEGLAFYGMIGIASGGVLNMVLDPLLIFGLNLGTAGAAIATAISQVVSFCILLTMTNRRAGAIPIRFRDFTPKWSFYKRYSTMASPPWGGRASPAYPPSCSTPPPGVYGDAAIAAMSIVTRFVMFINSSMIGFGQGFQPVCGFCFGAGRYSRVRQAYTYCIKVGTVCCWGWGWFPSSLRSRL